MSKLLVDEISDADGTGPVTVTDGLNVSSGAVFNEAGLDVDFRVESDTITHMLFVDAGLNTVSIGHGGPRASLSLDVEGDIGQTWADGERFIGQQYSTGAYRMGIITNSNDRTAQLVANAGDSTGKLEFYTNTNRAGLVSSSNDWTFFEGVTINENGNDNDFRVESDTNTHMLYVDAGANKVSVGTGSPQGVFTVIHSLSNSSDWWTNSQGSAYLQNLIGHTVIKFNNETGYDSKIVYNSSASTGFSLFDRTSLQTSFQVYSNAIVLNEDSADRDFRVESDANTHMLYLDASVDRISMGTSESGDGTLTLRSTNNNFAMVQEAAVALSGGGLRGRMYEGVYSIAGNNLNNQLKIPITSQGGLWVQYQVELSVVTAEYNLNSAAKGGSCIFSFTSLTVLSALVQQQVTGNISSVALDSANMNVLINFSSAYTAGQSNYEGVIVHAKVLSYAGQYVEMDNATLN